MTTPSPLRGDEQELEYRTRLQAALGSEFELRELIGRGGFGSVYAAWDRKLERDVAVKAIRHDLFPTPVVLERFQREAKALAQLRHPHILPVYEVGVGDGIAFMVTPFIKGDTLGGMLRRGERLSPHEAIRLITEIARALDAAHRAGIIHRDVKPDNILIEGHDRHAVLADFGIAKAAGGTELTTAGVAIGSPKYMSPEQASAEKEVDARSDIYSLGAVAYELLSGRRPYEAESFQRLLVLQLTTEPPGLASVAPDAPAPVAAAVMRALERDPTARWQSAGELAAALGGGETRAAAPERESWLARRGLVLASINLLGVYIAIVSVTLIQASGIGSTVATAVNFVRRPFMLAVGVVMLVAYIELLVTLVRRRPSRAGGTWKPALRAAFGQPRWWQPWYPRALRSPESAWDLMPLEIKALRTLLWLGLAAIPVAVPLIFDIPRLAGIAEGANMPLPLPAIIWIKASGLMSTAPGFVGMALIPIGIVAVSLARRVAVSDVIALLLTWKQSAWNSPAGLKLRGGVGARANRGPAAVALTLGAIALVAAWAFRGNEQPRATRSAPGVVVLPFTVQGGADVAYLGEGMISLLAANLDGAGDLWSIDPRTVLTAVHAEPVRSEENARRLAARLGAAHFVTGEIVQLGQQLRITARLQSVDGSGTAVLAKADGPSAEPLPLVDQITSQLLAARSADRQGGLADATTASLPALKSYLAGQQALVSLDWTRALESFERAVALDSSFAKAHLGVAWAGWWLGRDVEPGVAAAFRHSGKLSQREQQLLRAHRHFFRGEDVEAERLYREVLLAYPKDLDALYPLGELLVHYSFRRGKSYVTAARDVLDRVLQIQPTHGETLFHRIHLAAHARDIATVDSLSARVLALPHGATAEVALIRMLRAFMVPAAAAQRDTVMRDLRSADDFSVVMSAGLLAAIVDDRASARIVAQYALQPNRAEGVQGAGRILLAQMDVSEGKVADALRALETAARVDPDAAMFFRAAFSELPFRTMSAGERRSLRAALEGWKGENTLAPAGVLPSFMWLPGSAYAGGRSYFIGLLDASEGKDADASQQAIRLEQLPYAGAGDLHADLVRAIRAEAAHVGGDESAALAELERMTFRSPFAQLAASPLHERTRERYMRAMTLLRLGRDQESFAWFESIAEALSMLADPYRAPVLFRMATILERRGDRARAAVHYAEVARLWKDADPEFRPVLDSAIAGFRRLGPVR